MELVPAGVDRTELADAIARRGQELTAEASQGTYECSRPQTRLDKGFQLAMEAAPYVLVGVVYAPIVVLYALAKRGY
jgi:hypothetical protein